MIWPLDPMQSSAGSSPATVDTLILVVEWIAVLAAGLAVIAAVFVAIELMVALRAAGDEDEPAIVQAKGTPLPSVLIRRSSPVTPVTTWLRMHWIR